MLIQNASNEKLMGSFYTPEPIAKFILKWAINGNKDYDILEPSCGDGVFLQQIKNTKFQYKSITAIELDSVEADKAKKIRLHNTSVINTEFHKYCNSTKDLFDLIIGNPPFIRYQYFDKQQQIEAEKIFIRAGLKYSKLANPWVSFIVGSTLLLKKHGKIAFVVPAEILQVSYAAQLRNFLAKSYNKIVIISFKKLVFSDVQQEVVLLFCEKNGKNFHHIEHIELENADQLSTTNVIKLKNPTKQIDFESNKWTFYFLEQEEINFIEELLRKKTIPTFGQYARAEVGITTGSNQFFTVPKRIVQNYDLDNYAKPMVGRSVQLPSVIFTMVDWKNNVKLNARTYFLKFPKIKELKKNTKILKYIKFGEKQNVDKFYKCTIRDEWHVVPSAWVSQGLFQRRNNIYPKLVINEFGAYTTDTMHRITFNDDINVNGFVASYYNSLSLAFAEICGRSHGGGALELMPNEVEKILIPYRGNHSKLLGEIDKMMRSGKKIEEILEFTDPIILKEGYGFTQNEIKLVRGIWKKLLRRRQVRAGVKQE